MRTTHVVAFVVLLGGSFAGSVALAWDQNPFAMYFQRSDSITLGEGDAKAVNSATHVIDPWPPYVGNRRIPVNGDRLSRAVERYRQGSYRQPAPPIAPYVGPPVRAAAVSAAAVSAAAVSAAAVSAAAAVVLRAAAVRVAAVGPLVAGRYNEAESICGRIPKIMNAGTIGP